MEGQPRFGITKYPAQMPETSGQAEEGYTVWHCVVCGNPVSKYPCKHCGHPQPETPIAKPDEASGQIHRD
jgi:hypothetical protein